MNQTIEESVLSLQPIYSGLTDAQVIGEIRTGRNAGEALFYLLFGRYQEMLHVLFVQEATAAMEFSDFMLELNMRLYNQGLAAIKRFDETKASFKTYLSKIAHNLLYDLRKKEKPTIDCPDDIIDSTSDDGALMMQLIDAINSYADKDGRYVLFKVIEGYKSKEIATMLTSKRHEEGTLDESETLKPSYIDTIRSRSMRNIRANLNMRERDFYDISAPYSCIDGASPISEPIEAERSAKTSICEERTMVYNYCNPFIENLRRLLHEVFF